MNGWKWAPVEPTQEMLDAGCEIDAWAVALAELEAEYKQAGLTYPQDVVPAGRYLSVQYRAMLAAAPTPPADAVTDAMQSAGEAAYDKVLRSTDDRSRVVRAAITAALAARGTRRD